MEMSKAHPMDCLLKKSVPEGSKEISLKVRIILPTALSVVISSKFSC